MQQTKTSPKGSDRTGSWQAWKSVTTGNWYCQGNLFVTIQNRKRKHKSKSHNFSFSGIGCCTCHDSSEMKCPVTGTKRLMLYRV